MKTTNRDEPFTLARQPTRRRQRKLFENNDAKPGKVLFAGSDCLPGQLDLIPSDGPAELPMVHFHRVSPVREIGQQLDSVPVRQIDFRGIDPACDHCCQPLEVDDEALVDDAGRVYCCCRCAGEFKRRAK